MKIISACIYELNIPFVESFSHSLQDRSHSDSIVVELITDGGASGFGEGVPRPYVTGETTKTSIAHIKDVLLPAVIGTELGDIELCSALATIDELLPDRSTDGIVAWNASRCAVELALVDLLFSSRSVSVNTILRPRSPDVIYSGVISSGPMAKVEKIALRCREAGFPHVKVKVTGCEDADRIAMVRDIMGPSVSIRLDANGAFNTNTAAQFLTSIAQYNIECIEQPIPRVDPTELATLRSASPIPLMADESIVTVGDADELIAAGAVDYFNLRVSKCGGLHNTLHIAQLAKEAGIKLQLGCQVGETAILSAAGRHIAAHLDSIRFVEGSYGIHLLTEDLAEEPVMFGPGGKASVLTGPGFGITIRKELLHKHARATILVQ